MTHLHTSSEAFCNPAYTATNTLVKELFSDNHFFIASSILYETQIC